MRPIDLFLTHLTFVNDLVLLLKGIPQTMAAFGLTNFLNDVGCKLVFYFHKVARDLSLCTTCFLSGFQAITLSPKSFWWSKFKARAPKYTLYIYYGKSSSWLVHISAFLSACFPACSSFVLIVNDSQVRRYYLALWEKTMI
ncbi:vomeronasal type-1 receptor 1-like [Sminthopsis crassicaudata]|uniref:vomeronasal type-1 receptor 1-like n=1 Tax=Sminthopsis crassicaudata TaxID=9301 RepID=UPI003D68788C